MHVRVDYVYVANVYVDNVHVDNVHVVNVHVDNVHVDSTLTMWTVCLYRAQNPILRLVRSALQYTPW